MTSEELDALSAKLYAENLEQFDMTPRPRHQHRAEMEAHAFACGWDWAIEAVRGALAEGR